MDQTIFTELIKFGGGTAILVALYFVLKQISQMIDNRNGNSFDKKFQYIQKTLDNDMRHELDRIWTSIDKLNNEVNGINTRLLKVELKLKNDH